MKRRDWLRTAGLGTLAAAAGGPAAWAIAAAAARRPRPLNILLIMADDLGHEKLGCYGGTSFPTPQLDKLAAGGMRFEHCYSNPLCTPSRVKIMTGRYLFRNYVGFGRYPDGEVSFGDVLKRAGYATCIGGKWQLSGKVDPADIGFDEYALLTGARYWGGGLNQTGEKVGYDDDQYTTDHLCDFFEKFMGRHRSRPFFIYYPMKLIHTPIQRTPDSTGAEDQHYGDMVRYMDKTVGRLVRTLDGLGLRQRTLVLFTGDNGSARASKLHGQSTKGGKGRMHDQGTRVPLIANCPGTVPAGKVCGDLVDFSDFLPTLAQAAGAPLPADRVIDGYSFYPQILGREGKPREWAFVHHWQHGRKPETQYQWARDKRFKLYRVVKGSDPKVDGRFYDVASDPLETEPIPPGRGSAETEAARRRLAHVLDTIKDHQTPPRPPV